MKHIVALITLLATLSASAQTVTFTTNSGNMSLVLYVTNLPAAERALLEESWTIYNRAVVATNANGTVNPKFLPRYACLTNYIASGTDTNGQPLFRQEVTTNAPMSRQAFLTLIANPKNARTAANYPEIVRDWCNEEQRKIGALRNRED